MRSGSTFLKVCASLTVIVVFFIASAGSTTTQATIAQDSAQQATLESTSVATAITALDDGAYPPCPKVQGVLVQGTQEPTLEATAEPTIAATVEPNLTPSPTLYLAEFSDKASCTLNADLWGMYEVPTAGDPDGGGIATITITRPATGPGEVCFKIEVAKITLPAAAVHIHRSAPGTAGPVVVPLVAPDADGAVTGCIKNVDRDLIKQILVEPGMYYVNIHTSDFPAGALRGQLVVPVAYNR